MSRTSTPVFDFFCRGGSLSGLADLLRGLSDLLSGLADLLRNFTN